jgi:hypothetical protein
VTATGAGIVVSGSRSITFFFLDVLSKAAIGSPHPDPLKPPLFAQHSRDVVGGTRPYPKFFPLQVGFKKHGHRTWVMVRSASPRRLVVVTDDQPVEMRPSDFLNIPACRRYRVEWTTAEEPTIWLAIHYGD